MLTDKRKRFINNLIKGMSQREAYRNAFPSSKKWKDHVVDSKASELFANGEVRERYNQLTKKEEDKAIMSSSERKKWLTGVLLNDIQEDVYMKDSDGVETRIGSKNADLNTKMKALDLLNKMDGDYIQDIRLSGDKNNPVIAQVSVIDGVAGQMQNINEDDVDDAVNS